MDNMQNFRTAFHGFNRDDVVHFLENMTAQHTIAVNMLQDDLKRTSDDLDAAQARCEELAQENEALTAKVEELNAQLEAVDTSETEALNARIAELEALCAEKDARIAELTPAEEPAYEDWKGEELLAYRRAESVERQTRSRAATLCDRTNALVSQLTAKLGQDRAGVEAAAEAIGSALDALQAALDSSRATLEDGAKDLGELKLELPEE